MTTEVRQWDIGTRIEIDLGESMEASTAQYIFALKPNGTVVVWTATVAGTVTRIHYVTEDGDLDVPGVWRLQAWALLPDGAWTSEEVRLAVLRSISRVT